MEDGHESDDDAEAAALEWVRWLTDAAHRWDSAEVLKRFLGPGAKSVTWMGLKFSGVPTDGVYVIQFGFSVALIQKHNPGLDPAYLVELINTEPGKEIGAWHETGSTYGDCVVLERYYYIPKEHRENWVYSDAIPERERELIIPVAKFLDPESDLATRGVEFARWLTGTRFVKYTQSGES